MDTKQVAELLHTNEQIIRAWVREGAIPAHRRPGGRKYTFLRREIFDWLIANRYQPEVPRMHEQSPPTLGGSSSFRETGTV